MSSIYVINPSAQTVAANGTIVYSSIGRRCGLSYALSGGNVVARCKPALHRIDMNATFIPETAGVATFTIMKNGMAITGAETSLQVAADTTYPVSITGIIDRNACCAENVYAVQLTGVSGQITNATMTMETAE